MKIFLVALMNLISVEGQQHIFIFTNPTFTTVEECKSWGKTNTNLIAQRLYYEYGPNSGPPQMLSCVNQNVVMQIQDLQKGSTET